MAVAVRAGAAPMAVPPVLASVAAEAASCERWLRIISLIPPAANDNKQTRKQNNKTSRKRPLEGFYNPCHFSLLTFAPSFHNLLPPFPFCSMRSMAYHTRQDAYHTTPHHTTSHHTTPHHTTPHHTTPHHTILCHAMPHKARRKLGWALP